MKFMTGGMTGLLTDKIIRFDKTNFNLFQLIGVAVGLLTCWPAAL